MPLRLLALSAATIGPVNLKELAEVRQSHMPELIVRFAHIDEVARVAREVAYQHPQFAEETAFVLADEQARRDQANQPILRIVR
ncbi:hypothetical protein [Solirubrum puertoriconensis]|uniref:Uncharacterized protein n=1 Tax=Solirubrum puertoriconensis TaxID=1751427 RepID=A0A9X0L3V7_SOLP1|nr:hypothetical protein [Solirubrum puertoriconensis]KUG06907.1 hypothetical protein ASU33_06170 [Solirubrum puertoriconensis]